SHLLFPSYSCNILLYSSHVIFFFFLLIPPPPRPTLFPYTTLFRSVVTDRNPLRSNDRDGDGTPDFTDDDDDGDHTLDVTDADAEDRKSTRLNSSHSQISYAVFCLKKKKQTINKK